MKLLALMWWIDRWRKSTAYTDMSLAEQGAYRNLLDEAHLRGGAIPNNERTLAKACGSEREWRKVRTAVMAHFVLEADGWRNVTLDRVLKESVRRATNQQNWRDRRNNGTDNAAGNEAGNGYDNGPHQIADNDGASPDPDQDQELISESNVVQVLGGGAHTTTRQTPPTARSKRPIFTGQRLTVFEWMLDDCLRTLGPFADDFDLHDWFFKLDAAATAAKEVIPRRDGGQWLQQQLLREARRRGLEPDPRRPCTHEPPCPSTWAHGQVTEAEQTGEPEVAARLLAMYRRSVVV